jgi:hypothetical protein
LKRAAETAVREALEQVASEAFGDGVEWSKNTPMSRREWKMICVIRSLTVVLELALVIGGTGVIAWQFFGAETAQSGWFVIGAASAVSIGLMLLYEGFVKP